MPNTPPGVANPLPTDGRPVMSVSELNREVKHLLEGSVPLLWVGGEISNFAAPSSGHWYFTLKDARAQVRCAMFRGRNRNVRFPPANGREVLARARVSLYEGRGEFQLIIEHLEEAGFGALMRQLEQLKAKLQAEGLFDLERKKPLPYLPATIGIITSATGAAVRDMIQVLGRRYPAARIELLPVAVQGQGAAQQIASAISLAGRLQRHDLLIVGRGGGSLEDLWSFNEEVVVRALAACPIPTISAVGHETDTTLADLAADVRAPTPSAAAEIASANAAALRDSIANSEARLLRAMQSRLRHHQQQVQLTSNRIRHPREQLQNHAQRLDHLELRLRQAIRQDTTNRAQRLSGALRAFNRVHPEQRLSSARDALAKQRLQLQHAAERLLAGKRDKLLHSSQLLHSVSPLAVLDRGYAIVRDEQKRVVRDAAQIKPGQRIFARLANGEISAVTD
ncbi:exodeoxyribonuclease VII large subunit [Microbulbifer hydrolyticus]|uniref:Exodeoxyribonuclease 7 large subunit n=1 Tax=Microbulbifer hydrolyticus TaxID=48074 RepID=A0A6P1TD27_9GAMM|nr:exodeoxyribonuclease VII large subunit [Microbulbifer hydrolyticus]MBB5209898.1 exodeoxyribonuclease VII large subunit [Microbulbifer hydrolyticus]QHQ39563.1 exodeoxyribonuclease VII large subunit [Microbulbifer hydrolyticus]